ncbi:MAG: PaaI family thioesterase [Candidatus Eremiobacteraeota bacterium]|nr:PaaI family thioesterase [Candidatus Eremiobacteraeota bacterium]
MKLQDDEYCFACGEKNPIGLKLKFDFPDDIIEFKFTPQKEHQGWADIIHGGILATLMDEAMAQIIIHRGYFGVTSGMEIRFLRPAKVEEELTISGEIKSIEGKKINVISKIVNTKGKTVASSKGVYILKTEYLDYRKMGG